MPEIDGANWKSGAGHKFLARMGDDRICSQCAFAIALWGVQYLNPIDHYPLSASATGHLSETHKANYWSVSLDNKSTPNSFLAT